MSSSKFEVWGRKYGLFLSITIGLLVWFILPMPQGITPTQHKLLTIFASAVTVWITQGIGFGCSAFVVCALLYFWVGNPTGQLDKEGNLVRNAGFAITGFSNVGLWLQQAGFIISIAMMETGVAKRAALTLLRYLGKRPFGAILTPMLANMFVAPLTPSNTARTAALLPVVEGVAEAYKAEKGSNFGKALFTANTMSSNITASAFMT
ncbi:MAG: anion permease, partial [Deltaproteobacteria bacterium]|nr:anion permease [Deltaproteobacteria bacterium]